jgi:hypothetical protein
MVSSIFCEGAESRTINTAKKNSASCEFYLVLLAANTFRSVTARHEKSPRFCGLDFNTVLFYEVFLAK